MKRIIYYSFALLLILSFNFTNAKPFSHDSFNKLLRQNVKDGYVNYNGFKSESFNEYLKSLAAADPSELSRNDQLAFWINAYNAFTIKNVLDHPGITSPLKEDGFFKKDKFKIAGKELTLDEIEHETIRPTFKEPLIHFGVTCASNGCPKLINEAYKGSSVLNQLKENAKKYLNSDRGFRLDKKTNTVYLSQIMNWFKEDFNNGNQLSFILPYLNEKDAAYIKSNRDKIKVDFLEYDWSLNGEYK